MIDTYSWCDKIINGAGGYKAFQKYELAVENYEHDICVSIWILRCLANPECDGSEEVIDAILKVRKKHENE